MLDSSLTTAEDVEQRTGYRYLAGVPALASIKGGRGVDPIESVGSRPSSAFAESFRNLRAALNYSFDGAAQVVAITSALPREGKTTTSICFARAVAQQGARVVLVDCDLRRRSLNMLIPSSHRGPNLVDVLAGEALYADALVRDEASGAMILPLGPSAGGSTDVLGGEAMTSLLSELRTQFDLIVLDTAPILPIADAVVLASKADAVVMVVQWRKTSEHAIRAALRMLPRGRVAVAGLVLNQIDMRKQAKFGLGDPASYYNQYKTYYG
jgi:succinoglycan biosynthesis transport protein ExoP